MPLSHNTSVTAIYLFLMITEGKVQKEVYVESTGFGPRIDWKLFEPSLYITRTQKNFELQDLFTPDI
jgi:hypothetical protein